MLTTFETDLKTTETLIQKFSNEIREKSILIVSESGLFNHSDLTRVFNAGAEAVLVGESLMRHADTKTSLQKLIGY